MRIVAAASDGITSINGATVQWSATNGATLSACSGAVTCARLTDESGKSETRVRVGALGTATITATLAPASYSPPKFVQTVVNGIESAKDISIFSPKNWVAQGATLDLQLLVRVLSNGSPLTR